MNSYFFSQAEKKSGFGKLVSNSSTAGAQKPTVDRLVSSKSTHYLV